MRACVHRVCAHAPRALLSLYVYGTIFLHFLFPRAHNTYIIITYNLLRLLLLLLTDWLLCAVAVHVLLCRPVIYAPRVNPASRQRQSVLVCVCMMMPIYPTQHTIKSTIRACVSYIDIDILYIIYIYEPSRSLLFTKATLYPPPSSRICAITHNTTRVAYSLYIIYILYKSNLYLSNTIKR